MTTIPGKIWNGAENVFSMKLIYPLEREYPVGRHRQLVKTLTSIIVLIVFVAVSTFNVATIGYALEPVFTQDPNSTLAQHHWYNNWIFNFGDDQLRPKCSAFEVPVGYQFFTSNQGFTYNIQMISFHNDSTSEQRTSLPYLNNTLENCQMTTATVNLIKSDQSLPGNSNWWSWEASTASSIAQCDVVTNEGNYTITMQTDFNGDARSFGYVTSDDPKLKASTWWGTRLLNNYYNGISVLTTQPMPRIQSPITTAGMNFVSTNVTDLRDENLFQPNYFFLSSDGEIFNPVPAKLSTLYNNASFQVSAPVTEGFFFAKVFRSIVLVDLGNSALPNLLLDPDLLQYALNPSDDFNRGSNGSITHAEYDEWLSSGITPPNDTNPRDANNYLPDESELCSL